MNDLLNNNTNPKNIEELYYRILKIITEIYEKIIPQSVKNRKNKDKAKMKDTEIISMQLLIECFRKKAKRRIFTLMCKSSQSC